MEGFAPQFQATEQVSFTNRVIWHLSPGLGQAVREKAMAPELEGKHFIRRGNLHGEPADKCLPCMDTIRKETGEGNPWPRDDFTS
ncbi:hypothetical protein BJX63DRAFT_249440 [Aspergillus granulosus]|uniref:Uncharacterized protein n=1 Tax=Aspergillus granulosus TaxID=176169 RepID=A0ABR4HA37_9EURO